MTATYDSLATSTLASAGTFEFTSIPGTYTDLRIIVNAFTTSAGGADRLVIYFNNDTASNYSSTNMTGNGSTAASARLTNVAGISTSTNAVYTTTPGMTIIDIFSYANTSVFKTAFMLSSNDNNGSGFVTATVGMRRNTAAITSVQIRNTLSAFDIGSTATLYGIKAE